MKRKVDFKKLLILLVSVIILTVISVLLFGRNNNVDSKEEKKEVITNFQGISLSDVREYVLANSLELSIIYEYSDVVFKDIVINSNLVGSNLEIVVSKGNIPYNLYKEKGVNELGEVPIMMYHGIVDTTTNLYTGGNVDKDGYNRTSNAFLADLEFYYQKGYRMVRLIDYVNGIIDVEMGYSPIVLTFDDGNQNNFKVIGKDESGNLIFDPNSAIGILESIKKKYPDFNVTATFFLNSGLCNQPEYNEEIMKWLVDNGYDIGNHTTNHANFSNINKEKTKEVVGKMYQILEDVVGDKYVNIVALPYGSPNSKNHSNYSHILSGEYDSKSYETIAALRVGWESELSPFNIKFDKTYLKRCRAYDNNGTEFDIEMNFKLLDKDRYISDGDKDTIVVPLSLENKVGNDTLKLITYEEE